MSGSRLKLPQRRARVASTLRAGAFACSHASRFMDAAALEFRLGDGPGARRRVRQSAGSPGDTLDDRGWLGRARFRRRRPRRRHASSSRAMRRLCGQGQEVRRRARDSRQRRPLPRLRRDGRHRPRFRFGGDDVGGQSPATKLRHDRAASSSSTAASEPAPANACAAAPIVVRGQGRRPRPARRMVGGTIWAAGGFGDRARAD